MCKKTIIFLVLLSLPLSFVAGQAQVGASSVQEMVQGRIETARERVQTTTTERESIMEDAEENIRERVSVQAREGMMELVNTTNRAHTMRMESFFRYLERMSIPLDRIEVMVGIVEDNLGISLTRTKEKIEEVKDEIDEVMEKAALHYETNYVPNGEEEVITEIREMIQEMNEHHRLLREEIRNASLGIRDVMTVFGEEMRERRAEQDENDEDENDEVNGEDENDEDEKDEVNGEDENDEDEKDEE